MRFQLKLGGWPDHRDRSSCPYWFSRGMGFRAIGILLILALTLGLSAPAGYAATKTTKTTKTAKKTVTKTATKSGKVFRNKDVLVLGDSISWSFGKYPVVAAKRLGGRVTNESYNGLTISYVGRYRCSETNSLRYKLAHDKKLTAKKLKKYEVVIIAAGTNDCAWSAITPAKMKKDLRYSLRKLRKANRKSTIILVTPLRRFDGDNSSLKNYRTAMRKLAKEFDNVYVIDGRKLVKSTERSKYYDRVHPKTSFGKGTLAKRLQKEIKTALTA